MDRLFKIATVTGGGIALLRKTGLELNSKVGFGVTGFFLGNATMAYAQLDVSSDDWKKNPSLALKKVWGVLQTPLEEGKSEIK